jgi:hypothetical protein
VIGISAQIRNVEEPFLESSIDKCNCIIGNKTTTEQAMQIVEQTITNGFFDNLVSVSYMYYSAIGTFLTIFFGLAFSILFDIFARKQSLHVKTIHDAKQFNPNFTSFTVATGRKLSSLIHHVAHDVSQSTLRVESMIKEVISHTNLHLHHTEDEEAIGILSAEQDENEDDGITRLIQNNKKMFFIGHPDEV